MPFKTAEIMSLKAAEIMRRDVVTTEPDASAVDVAELLAEGGMGVLPVCAKDGSLLGVIDEEHLVHTLGGTSALELIWCVNRMARGQASEHDCLQHLFLHRAKAFELMTRNIAAGPESMTLAEIVKLWTDKGVRPLLILRDGRLVGLVGCNEVAAALAQRSGAAEAATRLEDSVQSRNAA